MATPPRQFLPTTKFGLKGLQTFDNPQFIDDQALAACLNIILDGNEMAPRKGTKLLYDIPVGETSAPVQLFSYFTGTGTEFLLAKYSDNWYVWDSLNSAWVIIGSKLVPSPFFGVATWNDAFYSNVMYSHGLGANIAFFASSQVVPNFSSILMWPAGMTYLAAPATIGDTVLVVQNTSLLTLPVNEFTGISIGGTIVYGTSGTSFALSGTLGNNSNIITNLPTTGSIIIGATVSGLGVPPSTFVTNILSPTSIQISNNATSSEQFIFNGTASITTGSPSVSSFASQTTATGDVTLGSTFIENVSIIGGDVPVIGMAVVAGDIPTFAIVLNVLPTGPTYEITLSLGATATAIGESITFVNLLETDMLVTGSGIPAGTTIIAITGPYPLYTGFTMDNNATATINPASLVFALDTPTTLTFSEQNIIILESPITINAPTGTPVTAAVRFAPIPYFGNVVLVWLGHLVIATSQGLVVFSKAGDPLDFTGAFSGVSDGLGGRITDMRTFGQFFMAATQDEMEVGQAIVNPTFTAIGVFFTSYLAGQGMGAISSAGVILYNNQYYYPTLTNGILALTPSFTGTSSSAGIEVLTDVIQNLYKSFTFERGRAFNRKLYWVVSTAATPESPAQTYYLVYDMVRKAFTLCQHPSIDAVIYKDQLCLFGTDGNIYQGEYDSYEDEIGGESVGYLVEAFSKRYDFGDPSLPKDALYCMVQGRILTGTTLYVDILYNEGGSLGKQTYKIVGEPSSSYFTLPAWSTLGSSPFAVQVLGGGNLAVGDYRVYLQLNKSFKAHNFQLRFYTEKAGSYWTVGIVSPNVELSTIPTENVISPS
jgi:hypothetical protein